jgi:hypothetical protein
MITSATLQFSNGTTDYGTVASNGLAYDTVYSAFNLMDIFILTVPAMQLKVAENINRFSLTRVEL